LCQIAILCLHPGQCEPGFIKESSRGILYISTLKKLPQQAPRTGNRNHKKIAGITL
jgi:hypothetical protein